MSGKILALSVLILLSVLLTVRMAMAVVPELNLVFEVKDMGKVIFNGKIHADKGLKCIECHPNPFPNKRSAAGTYKMEKMNKGTAASATTAKRHLRLLTLQTVQSAIRSNLVAGCI